MKKRVYFLMTSLFAGGMLMGQETITHKVQYDDPDKENLAISVDYFTVDVAAGNEEKGRDMYADLGYGIQLNYMNLFDKMAIDVVFHRTYGSFGYFPSTFFEAGATWDISSSMNTTYEDFKIANLSGNRVKIMTDVPVTKSSRFRARAGLTMAKTNLETAYRIGFNTSTAFAPATGFYAGLEYSSNTNYMTLVRGSLKRRRKSMFRFYGDVIFTPIAGYGDSLYASAFSSSRNQAITDDIKHDLDSVGTVTRLGGIVGIKYIFSFPEGLNFNCDARLGRRPPYAGFYIYVGTGLTFNFGTKFQKNQEGKLED